MRKPSSKTDSHVTRIWFFALVFAVIAAAASIYVTRRDPQVGSGCVPVRDENGYQLDARSWTGTDEYRMQLQSGENLHIEWSLQAGVIDITIAMPENTPIYTANRVDFKDNPDVSFDVVIPESGDYVIHIPAKEATGTIGVRKP